MKQIRQKAVTLAFRLAKTARESVQLDHVKGLPGVEIFFTAAWLTAAVIWMVAIKVGAVQGRRAGILGMAGIIAIGWMVLKALRARSRREMREYYDRPAD
jgi:hypothetical protein